MDMSSTGPKPPDFFWIRSTIRLQGPSVIIRVTTKPKSHRMVQLRLGIDATALNVDPQFHRFDLSPKGIHYFQDGINEIFFGKNRINGELRKNIVFLKVATRNDKRFLF